MKPETIYFSHRQEWRKWLSANFDSKDEIWLEYPKKGSGKSRISYNDAVEEALCFGWIDSTVKSLNELTTIQRFTPRRKNSSFSQPNKERLKWLNQEGLIHPSIVQTIALVLNEEFVFPENILAELRKDPVAWQNFLDFPEGYKRIRLAFIDAAQGRPQEFEKRLNNFIKNTRANKIIKGYGGIEKYY